MAFFPVRPARLGEVSKLLEPQVAAPLEGPKADQRNKGQYKSDVNSINHSALVQTRQQMTAWAEKIKTDHSERGAAIL